MADSRITEALWDLVNSLHDASQATANSIVAAQNHNMKFAQNLFLNGVEVLESQTENAHQLMDQWGQQLQKQQEASQRLMNAALDVYMDFLRIPFSYYLLFVNATGSAMQQGKQFAQQATQQAVAAAGTAARRGREQTQEAAE